MQVIKVFTAITSVLYTLFCVLTKGSWAGVLQGKSELLFDQITFYEAQFRHIWLNFAKTTDPPSLH